MKIIKARHPHLQSFNCLDDNGNYTGGLGSGKGIMLRWQGHQEPTSPPEGATLPRVLQAALDHAEAVAATGHDCAPSQEFLTQLRLTLALLNPD